MSTGFVDISDDLVDGIFTILNTHVTYSGTTYPVYKSIPKTPALIYVYVGNVVYATEGTKDTFHYNGTVQIQIVDESRQRADKKLAQAILNVTRGLLKPARATVFSISPRTLIVLSPGQFNEVIEQGEAIAKIKLIDQYDFLIE
jgi:hypothetical protein